DDRILVTGIQIDQSSDAFGVSTSHRTQLFAAEGMSHQQRPLELERVHDSQHVVAEAVGSISRGGNTGRTEPAPRNAVDVVAGSELRSESVEHVRGVPSTW